MLKWGVWSSYAHTSAVDRVNRYRLFDVLLLTFCSLNLYRQLLFTAHFFKFTSARRKDRKKFKFCYICKWKTIFANIYMFNGKNKYPLEFYEFLEGNNNNDLLIKSQ